MNDQQIDNMEYVSIKVTPESMDAHIQCLGQNGYKISKPFSLITTNLMCLLLGMYLCKVFFV